MTRMPRLAALTLGILFALVNAARADVCDDDPTWRPGPANNPATCRELWEAIGTPQYARSDADTIIVCHTRYVLSHNNVNRTPDWVVERVTRAQVSGGNTRPKLKFTSEEHVCKGARAFDDDYKGSKFDRGHQAPSEDFNADADWMRESFILSNIVPQIGIGFNQGIWKDFEALVRKLAKDRGEVFVITGPINPDEDGSTVSIPKTINACRNAIKFEAPKKKRICDANDKHPTAPCEEGALVPVALYKIIYDPKSKRANAYVLPNVDHRALEDEKDSLEYLNRYRTTLKVVERYTGLQFLRAIPLRERRAQIDECIATMLH
jgi:endonuclease G